MKNKERNAIEEHAAEWVAREDRGVLAAAEQVRRDTWLEADPRHLGAYARAKAVYAHSRRLRALPPQTQTLRRWPSMHANTLLAMAAVVACVVLGIQLKQSFANELHRTRIGEVAGIDLADGSHMTLNSDSKAVVRFDSHERHVELKQGEVLFDVAKDATRPFVVNVDGARVVAVGTSFSVQRACDNTLRVVVREGVVDVSDASRDSVPVRVPANFSVLARPGNDMHIEPLAAGVLERRLAWRDGMIAFNGDTLAEAAAEFSRYSNVRILIDDPEVARRRVVGLYSSRDPAGFAMAVAQSLGLQVEASGNAVYLRQKTHRKQQQ